MKKPAKWSRFWFLKRHYRLNRRGRRRPVYLYVFPADRLGGWLCDGNDTRGNAMLKRQASLASSLASCARAHSMYTASGISSRATASK